MGKAPRRSPPRDAEGAERSMTSDLSLPGISSGHPFDIPLSTGCSNHLHPMQSSATSRPKIRFARIDDRGMGTVAVKPREAGTPSALFTALPKTSSAVPKISSAHPATLSAIRKTSSAVPIFYSAARKTHAALPISPALGTKSLAALRIFLSAVPIFLSAVRIFASAASIFSAIACISRLCEQTT